MPAEKLKFRCFACQQLLAVSPSKAGKVVSCPKCGEGLIVPGPEESTDAVMVSDFPDVGEIISREEADEIAVAMNFMIDTVQPIASTKPGAPILPSETVPDLSQLAADKPKTSENEMEGDEEESEQEFPGVSVPPPERLASRRQFGKSRDVQLPRELLLYWSMFAILSQVATFIAGLLIGHHVWKTP